MFSARLKDQRVVKQNINFRSNMSCEEYEQKLTIMWIRPMFPCIFSSFPLMSLSFVWTDGLV